jgi:biopolymer transport protein ExbB/TolQ
MMNLKRKLIFVVFAFLGIGVTIGQNSESSPEMDYKIHIAELNRVIKKNWLGVPKSMDCTIIWEVFEQNDDGWYSTDISSFDYFSVHYKCDVEASQEQVSDKVRVNYHTLHKIRTGKKVVFYVKGYHRDGTIVVSDTAWTITGRLLADESKSEHSFLYEYFPLSGRFPLKYIFEKPEFFDEAKPAGKWTFTFIWLAFLYGIFFPLRACFITLRLGSIFPMKGYLHLGRYEKLYDKYVNAEFKKNIINRWHDIIDDVNFRMKESLRNMTSVDMTEVINENATIWKDNGNPKIAELRKYINPKLDEGNGSADNKKDIEEKGSGDKKKLLDYPSVRVLSAGLENHELGGLQRMEVSKEVDRAIENRSSAELEKLRRKSHIDWFWNLGTLAPLMGLFGTAVGISHAFERLKSLGPDVTQAKLVEDLSNGIYVALWTTIGGLIVGISFMLLYYWFNNKLKWIYSKWEEIYVTISEKL